MTCARPPLVVLAPLAPAPTGNGLAMRVAMLVEAALQEHEVHLVVVPVRGPSEIGAELRQRCTSVQVLPTTTPGDHEPVVALLADRTWRSRLAALSPLDAATALAPPSLAAEVDLPEGVRTVLACRLVLAPLGLALAERAGAVLVVDADDDDERLLHDLGDHAAAEAHHRLARVCLPHADVVLAAGAPDAEAITERHDLARPVRVAPNAAPLPDRPLGPPPGQGRVLVVGNLTYEPNVRGVRWLVEEVLPLLPEPMALTLVGAPNQAVRALAGPRVEVRGVLTADELLLAYEQADVVAVPVHDGAGTRTKLLEAFSHRRPAVSTWAGAAGLDVVDGRHLVLADAPGPFADALRSARGDADIWASRLAAAEALATTTYHPDTVRRRAAECLRGTEALHRHDVQPSTEEPDQP